LVDTGTLGTVEYGAAVLGSPLIVVLAHTSCGAVKAACNVVNKNATFPGAIGPMIEPIVPAALAVRDKPGDFVNNAAKEIGLLELLKQLDLVLAGIGKLDGIADQVEQDLGQTAFVATRCGRSGAISVLNPIFLSAASSSTAP
jgi:carbonic anhydrase